MLGSLFLLLSKIICDCFGDSYSCESATENVLEFSEKQRTILARDIGGIAFFLNVNGTGFVPVSPDSIGFQIQRFTDCDQLYTGYCFTGINATSGVPILPGSLNGRVAVTLNLATGLLCNGAIIRLYTPTDALSATVSGLTTILLRTVNITTRVAFTQIECAAIQLVANGTGFSLNIFLPDLPFSDTSVNAVLPNGLPLTINLQRREITRICDFNVVRGLVDTLDRILGNATIRPKKEQLIMLSKQISADVARKKFGKMIYDDPSLLPRMVGGGPGYEPYFTDSKSSQYDDRQFESRFEYFDKSYDWYKNIHYERRNSIREYGYGGHGNYGASNGVHPGHNDYSDEDRIGGYGRYENEDFRHSKGGEYGYNNLEEGYGRYGNQNTATAGRYEDSSDSLYSSEGSYPGVSHVLYNGNDSECGCEECILGPRGHGNYNNVVGAPNAQADVSFNTNGGYERQVDNYGENTFDNIIATLFRANLLCKLASGYEGYNAEIGLMSNKLFNTLLQTNSANNAARDALDNLYITSNYPALEQDRMFEALQAFSQKFSAKDLFNFGDLFRSIKSEDVRNQFLGNQLDALKLLGAPNIIAAYENDPALKEQLLREKANNECKDIVEENEFDSEYDSEYTDSELTDSEESSSTDAVRRKQPEEEGTSLGTKVIYGSIAVTIIVTVATAIFYFI